MRKFGGKLVAVGFEQGGPGISLVPHLIFRKRKELGIFSSELLVVLAILSHRTVNYPDFAKASLGVLKNDTGLSTATIKRVLKSLREKELLFSSSPKEAPDRNKVNQFDLRPLARKLMSLLDDKDISDGAENVLLTAEEGRKLFGKARDRSSAPATHVKRKDPINTQSYLPPEDA